MALEDLLRSAPKLHSPPRSLPAFRKALVKGFAALRESFKDVEFLPQDEQAYDELLAQVDVKLHVPYV
jgi:hypothetical protein